LLGVINCNYLNNNISIKKNHFSRCNNLDFVVYMADLLFI